MPSIRRPATRAVALLVTLAGIVSGGLLPPGTPALAAPALAAPAASAVSPSSIPVELDGLTVEFDVPPLVTGGRALVPFRALAEALGCTVEWDPAASRVHAVGPGAAPRTVELWVDRTDAMVNGETRTMDVPAQIVEGRTLIPLRFFGEALGAAVDWNPETRTIAVVSPPRPMRVLGYYALGNTATSSWTELFGQSYPNSGPAGTPIVAGASDIVSEVACAWFVLNPANGGIVLNDAYSGQKRPDNWADVVFRCREYSVAADMMVHWATTIGGVADPAIYAFLADPEAMQRAIREIVAYAADFRGVNLDLELLGQRQTGEELAVTRQRFTVFVELLAAALHAQGRTLTLSLHPLNSWYPGYDWAALAPLADGLVIMAYGYSPKGQPQPIGKVVEAVDLALAVAPREKVFLGLLAQYETEETTAVKVGLAKRKGLAGIALWRLGVVGPERLGAIRAAVIRVSP